MTRRDWMPWRDATHSLVAAGCIGIVCESVLDAVHSLIMPAITPRDCWTDFRKVVVDCAIAPRPNAWDKTREAVHCLDV